MTPCPSDDVLGAHVKRALAERDAEVVATHLDSCDSCRQVVLAAVRGGVATKLAIGTPTDPAIDVTAPTRRTAFAIGQRIGRYQIRELLGAGGMGQVFSSYDAELDREVALKVMRPELVGATGVLAERLVRESRMMAKLAHPSVITVYDVGRANDAVFIAMELIRGETLGSYVHRVKPGWREIVALLERAAHGLAAAHDAGIIHRDFKPDNVLLEVAGGVVKRVVVTDFGVARTAGEEPERPRDDDRAPASVELTAKGTTVGTPAYMAPEQLAGDPLDVRADVFAFAVSAWELLFGDRPFGGRSVAEIRVAMQTAPEPPRGHAMPARVVAALTIGLAIEPAGRHRDMHVFARVLAATHARSKRVVAIAGGVAALALVGSGLAASRMLDSHASSDPCARTLETFDAAYPEAARIGVRAMLAKDPVRLGKLDRGIEHWRLAHAQTCKPDAEPPQQPAVAACLEARRLEIAGIVEDLILDGPSAHKIVDVASDPSSCLTPAPGLIAARVPADPAVRRKVSALRYRAFVAETARDVGDYKRALAESAAIVAEAKPLWAPFHAESLYLLGTTESQGGDTTKGLATLREAAAVAERVHHDYIAANAWIQIVQSTAFDTGDPTRALEYIAFAEAALERIGNKPNVAVMFHYTKGGALSQANRNVDAEAEFRKALALAETSARELVPVVTQGLGFVLEGHGKYDEAVPMYRRALAELVKLEPRNVSNEITFRYRLAAALDMIGQSVEAEAEARAAVALADQVLDETNLDRSVAHAQLAQVLQNGGKLDDALREATFALERIGKHSGERSARYGDILTLVGMILNDLERFAEAEARLSRACEIAAFEVGDGSAKIAECWHHLAVALSGLDKNAAALELIDRGFPILVKAFGESHPHIANAYVIRGALHVELGNLAKAVPDLERAVAMFGELGDAMDAGHLAAAEFKLALAVYPRDKARGRELATKAAARFEHAAVTWKPTADDARDWLAKHR